MQNELSSWKTGIIIGRGTIISPRAAFHGHRNIKIGRNCRIDDFAVLSAGDGCIEIGDNVHIGPHCCICGAGKITIGDRCGLSGRASIYSSSGDMRFLGSSGNPMLPDEHERAISADVVMEPGSVLGVGAVLMPGVLVGEDTVVGAMGLVPANARLDPRSIYAGVPVRRIGDRVERP